MTLIRILLAIGLLLATVPATAQRGPAPGPTNLPPESLALICAPSLAFEAPPMPLRLTGGQDSFVRVTHTPGDLVTVNAGTDNGIDIGQEFFVRRAVPSMSATRVIPSTTGRRAIASATGSISRDNPAIIRTVGWIRIYAVDNRMSLATIVHACETIDVNDYLEPFVVPTVPAASLDRPPAQRSNYGRILIGNDRRQNFARGDFFVVDRGSDHGVTPGSQFVIYRDKLQANNFLFELGEAVAVEVRPESSTLQATLARDAFIAGDYVALRK